CLGFGAYCLSSFFAFAGSATLIASSPYKVRLSLRRERIATKAFSPTQTRLLSRRCLVRSKLDGSRTETIISWSASTFDRLCRAFGLTASFARHHPVGSQALPPDNRNPVRSSHADGDVGIWIPQDFDF